MIKNIINDRLKLQSTQRALEYHFGLLISKIDITTLLKNPHNQQVIKQLDNKQKKQLIILLGGPINIKQTSRFIKQFIPSPRQILH